MSVVEREKKRSQNFSRHFVLRVSIDTGRDPSYTENNLHTDSFFGGEKMAAQKTVYHTHSETSGLLQTSETDEM